MGRGEEIDQEKPCGGVDPGGKEVRMGHSLRVKWVIDTLWAIFFSSILFTLLLFIAFYMLTHCRDQEHTSSVSFSPKVSVLVYLAFKCVRGKEIDVSLLKLIESIQVI